MDEGLTKNNIKEINISIKRGPMDNRERQLIIAPDFIQFDERTLLSDPHTRFNKDEITDFRYGIRWIYGWEFTIGREYEIFIRNVQNNILRISFKSFYGINKKKLNALFSEIINAIWKFYFAEKANILLNKFNEGEAIIIDRIRLTQYNVVIKSNGVFREQEKEIPWNKVKTSEYKTYFGVYSKDDAVNINAGYYYHMDWNSDIVRIVLLSILEEKSIKNN